jgi:hypothetical protein
MLAADELTFDEELTIDVGQLADLDVHDIGGRLAGFHERIDLVVQNPLNFRAVRFGRA